MGLSQIFGTSVLTGTVVGGVLFLLQHFFGGYFGRKGANRADKEDADELTKITEAVRSAYSQELAKLSETLRAVTSMRLLAGEKRLEVHQKVYSIAVDMQTNAFLENIEERSEMQKSWYSFWKENCLYMEPDVRSAFLDAATAFHVHRDLVKPPMPRNAEDAQLVIDNMKRMVTLGHKAEKAMKLPPISDELMNVLTGSKSTTGASHVQKGN